MANRWKIPEWLENKARARDKNCIYCGILFNNNKKKESPTIEHIDNLTSPVNLK